MRTGNLFVISGPSGAGKGTLVARLVNEIDDLWLSISTTTRKPRGTERNGVEYNFVSDAEFDRLIACDGLLEWACVHGARYGTPRAHIEHQMACAKQIILEIDVQGAFQVKEKMPEAHLVFIEPPSLDVLRMRLEKRATDAPEEIEKRLKTAKLELSQKMKYDIALVNDDLDETTLRLISYVNKKANENEVSGK